MSKDVRAPDVIPLSDLPPCKRGLSRRAFCAATGSGLIAIGLGACDGGPARLSTGSIDDSSGGGGGGDSPDMGEGGGGGGSPDMAHGGGGGGSNDMAHGGGGGACSGTLNAGAASAIAVGAAKHFSDNINYDLFVCRDAGGLFTVDARCTHAGCDVKLQSGHWYCNCHGATFAFDGTKPTSPAHSPLVNYEVCVDASGNISVDYNTTVSNTTRV
jgi:nitrite reductase/ring-hydroxylating ferredoxin subunit